MKTKKRKSETALTKAMKDLAKARRWAEPFGITVEQMPNGIVLRHRGPDGSKATGPVLGGSITHDRLAKVVGYMLEGLQSHLQAAHHAGNRIGDELQQRAHVSQVQKRILKQNSLDALRNLAAMATGYAKQLEQVG